MHRLAAILAAALAIPAAAALQLGEQLLIGHVAWLHIDRLAGIFKRLRAVMQTRLRERAKVIPAGVALMRRHAAQRVERLGVMPRVDIVFRRAHLDHIVIRLLLILTLLAVAIAAEKLGKGIVLILSLTVAAIPAVAAGALLLLAVIAAARTRCATLPPVHDFLVRLLNLHELLFSLRRIRLAHVCIRMIDLAQLSVGLLDLVVARRGRNAQYLIRIRHDSFFAFLRCVACSNRIQMPE